VSELAAAETEALREAKEKKKIAPTMHTHAVAMQKGDGSRRRGLHSRLERA
jgi:hypothetical protein